MEERKEPEARNVLIVIISALSIAFSAFQLYTSIFGVLEAYLQREIHLLFALALVFLIYPGRKGRARRTIGWFDLLLVAVCLTSFGYMLLNYTYLLGIRIPYLTPYTSFQYFVTISIILLTLEGTRRALGPVLPAIALGFFFYVWVGKYLPGIFHHAGFSLEMLLDLQVFSKTGIFGIALGVSATYLFVFILFGTALSASGFGDLLMEVAKSTAGRTRGGPAKIAVFVSALFGMISGSSTGNAVTTGAFTIPLMKRAGFSAEFASAVEAAASTGGQVMPPMLGAAALLMVTLAGVPYVSIMKWSILPAILFFAGVWFMVDFRCAAKNIGKATERGNWKEELKAKGLLILPIAVLLYFLFAGRTIMFSGVSAVISIFVLANVRKTTRMSARKNLQILERAAQGVLPIAMATATAGMIIAVVGLTGLGNRFSAMIVDASGQSKLLALALTMLAGFILGMGMPTAPAYIVQVALIVPALIKIGVPDHVAHLFVVYFAPMSMITPPVCITAFAAAGVGGANQMRTGFAAVKLAAAGFIVPFMFVYNQNLLLEGVWYNVIIAAATALVGVYALSFSLEGFWIGRLNPVQRVMGLAAAVVLIFPGLATDLIGICLIVVTYFWQRYGLRTSVA